MKAIHVFLCLILWRCINAEESGAKNPSGAINMKHWSISSSIFSITAKNGCTSLPRVENADILNDPSKTNYTEGDAIRFECRVGYVSTRRITYKCSGRRWTTTRQISCLPKQCELPEDISNGHYSIINGTDFVFGTVIKYTCNKGYVTVGRSNTRSCTAEGWNNQVPVCEAVKCLAEIKHDNMIVSGLEDDNFVSYGHVLHFKCSSSEMMLKGEPEVSCLSDGKWSSPFPTCGGHCGPPPSIPFADIKSTEKDLYRHNEWVEYQCMQYYTLLGQNFKKCQFGQWRGIATCLEPCIITIEEMDRRGIQLYYGQPRKLYAKHKEPVQFECKRYPYRPFRSTCDNGTIPMPFCN